MVVFGHFWYRILGRVLSQVHNVNYADRASHPSSPRNIQSNLHFLQISIDRSRAGSPVESLYSLSVLIAHPSPFQLSGAVIVPPLRDTPYLSKRSSLLLFLRTSKEYHYLLNQPHEPAHRTAGLHRI